MFERAMSIAVIVDHVTPIRHSWVHSYLYCCQARKIDLAPPHLALAAFRSHSYSTCTGFHPTQPTTDRPWEDQYSHSRALETDQVIYEAMHKHAWGTSSGINLQARHTYTGEEYAKCLKLNQAGPEETAAAPALSTALPPYIENAIKTIDVQVRTLSRSSSEDWSNASYADKAKAKVNQVKNILFRRKPQPSATGYPTISELLQQQQPHSGRRSAPSQLPTGYYRRSSSLTSSGTSSSWTSHMKTTKRTNSLFFSQEKIKDEEEEEVLLWWTNKLNLIYV